MTLDELTDTMTTTVSDDYATSVQLMLRCLQVIPFRLPVVAMTGIDVAQRYWYDRSASKEDLERARVACWNYLDERAASTNTEAPEFCAIRAVICTLYADAPSDDTGELVEFFNQMLRGALPAYDEKAFSEKVLAIVEEFSREVSVP